MNKMKVLKYSLSEHMDRWTQWLIMFLYMNFLLTGALAGWIIWFLLFLYSPMMRYPLLLYTIWIFYDRKAGELGERRNNWIRNLKIWKYHNEYFPARLHKTAELDPEKNYLICAFPHGILCSGAFAAYGNDYGGFSKLFPGLQSYLLTLGQHFITPFIREYALTIGALPASATCLNYFLSKKKGVALALLVGGAQESFLTKPGEYRINLKKRKGFLKIAIKNGTSLVPSISFGEPDIYDQIRFPEGSIGSKLQIFIKRITGIAPVIFYGQFGAVPHRKPLNIVVGKPLEVEKIEEPTEEQVDNLHDKFTEALLGLFETEKHKYLENAGNVHLQIF